jgi:hypothetical protein
LRRSKNGISIETKPAKVSHDMPEIAPLPQSLRLNCQSTASPTNAMRAKNNIKAQQAEMTNIEGAIREDGHVRDRPPEEVHVNEILFRPTAQPV